MPLTLDGDDGISGIDGSAATPAIQGADSNTGITFGTDIVNVVTGGSTRATVDSSGNVGIGTTTPGRTLDVNGIIRSDGTSGGLAFGGNSSTPSEGVAIHRPAADTLAFVTASTEHMRLTSAGYLKASTDIGGTGVYSAGTYHALHSDNANWTLAIDNSSSTDPYGILVDFSQDAPDNNTHSFFLGRDSSADRFRVWSDGDCDNHDNSYGGFSDEKLKQDIVDAGSQWDDVKNLRVRKFKFKSDVELYGAEAKTLIGVVAQETELVSPGLVKTAIDFDDEGNDLGTTTKAVRYSVLYMKAVKALQEAMTRIEQLETRVAQLEGGAS